MNFLRLVYTILFRAFAGPKAIAGHDGPHKESFINIWYN
jgi:hypothetical protein